MSYNPFDDSHVRLNKQLNEKKDEIINIRDWLNWYESIDCSLLEDSLTEVLESRTIIEQYIENDNGNINKTRNEVKNIDSKLKSRKNPFNWFNAEQSALRKKKSNLIFDIVKIKNQLMIHEGKLKALLEKQKEIESTTKTYNEFDKSIYNSKLNKTLSEFAKIEELFSESRRKKEAVDYELKDVVEQINAYQHEIGQQELVIGFAEQYNRDLNNARNSYERMRVHETCDYYLGDGKPQAVIQKANKVIRQLHRDLKKAEDRAKIIGLKASRKISKIVIDGSNMCYEGEIFVGFEPLKSVVRELRSKFNLTLVFDSTIIGKSNMDIKTISGIFQDVKSHIVQPGAPADETIIALAGNDKTCYVLSNDRFGDYRDKEVVKNGRIIKYEMINGRVLISDLGVDTTYCVVC